MHENSVSASKALQIPVEYEENTELKCGKIICSNSTVL